MSIADKQKQITTQKLNMQRCQKKTLLIDWLIGILIE